MFEHFYWYAIVFAIASIAAFAVGLSGIARWRGTSTIHLYLIMATVLMVLSMVAMVLNNLATGCST